MVEVPKNRFEQSSQPRLVATPEVRPAEPADFDTSLTIRTLDRNIRSDPNRNRFDTYGTTAAAADVDLGPDSPAVDVCGPGVSSVPSIHPRTRLLPR